MKKINLLQIGCISEWALAKFFPAIFKYGLSEYFDLVGICGLEPIKTDVIDKLSSEIGKREIALEKGKKWREENTNAEIESAKRLKEDLESKKIDYYSVINGKIPKEGYDAAVIHTSNTTHLDYIELLLKNNKHVLCEKPLVTVTDENHKADEGNETYLKKLKELVKDHKSKCIMMDAEHYSAKKASMAFYENIEKTAKIYGKISGIKGYTYEKDDPEKQRTRDLLCRKNRTGLLLDMGVHLFGIITNIEGEIGKILSAEYDIYPGHKKCKRYDVETYVKTKFEISGNLFWENTEGEFTFAKFINKSDKLPKEDNKKVEVTFENRDESGKTVNSTVLTIDFIEGTVIEYKDDGKTIEWHCGASQYEYVNILKDFYIAIEENIHPRTSFEHSIKTLEAIYRVYEEFPVEDKNLRRVYGR